MNPTVLKVTFKKETRRVPLNPTTWNVAEDNLRAVFDNLPERIGLTYYDDEDDLITVSSDPELIEAFRLLEAKKTSAYKFNLVELKELKQEISEEERERKLEKIQEKKQRKEERAKVIQAKKEEREKQREEKEKQREEKKLLKKKEKELKLKEKDETEKKEKKVSFSDFLQEIKSTQIQLKQVETQPAKVFPDAPVVAQWKASVPEPEVDDDEVFEEETIDISGEPDCDLEDFIEVKETPAPNSVPIPPAKTEVPVEIPKEKEPKKEVDLLELQLTQLAEMGFVDRERNVELLLMNNMEMTEVVKVLLGM